MKQKFWQISSAESALSKLKENKFSRWYSQKEKNTSNLAANRLCHNLFEPHINPLFKFNNTDSVFTVGSCFARGLEKSLLQDKINVLSITDFFNNETDLALGTTASGYMNKYNTASIYYEFKWALKKENQNGENFIKVSEDKYFDSNTNPNLPFINFEGTLKRRNKLQTIFQQVENCKLLTITLGLIEVWHDKELNIDLNVMPPARLISKYPDRFEFKVLSFEENLNNLENLYSLLQEYSVPELEIVVTVSPVPLQATFTGKDIVEANTYSKSMLRTVAETWATNHQNVHYFPSFEIVINSNQNIVWEDDRRHVKGSVAQYIMEIFKLNYLNNYEWNENRMNNINSNLKI